LRRWQEATGAAWAGRGRQLHAACMHKRVCVFVCAHAHAYAHTRRSRPRTRDEEELHPLLVEQRLDVAPQLDCQLPTEGAAKRARPHYHGALPRAPEAGDVQPRAVAAAGHLRAGGGGGLARPSAGLWQAAANSARSDRPAPPPGRDPHLNALEARVGIGGASRGPRRGRPRCQSGAPRCGDARSARTGSTAPLRRRGRADRLQTRESSHSIARGFTEVAGVASLERSGSCVDGRASGLTGPSCKCF
jgi:hypothetical protein